MVKKTQSEPILQRKNVGEALACHGVNNGQTNDITGVMDYQGLKFGPGAHNVADNVTAGFVNNILTENDAVQSRVVRQQEEEVMNLFPVVTPIKMEEDDEVQNITPAVGGGSLVEDEIQDKMKDTCPSDLVCGGQSQRKNSVNNAKECVSSSDSSELLTGSDNASKQTEETIFAPPKYNLSQNSPLKGGQSGTKLPQTQVMRPRGGFIPQDRQSRPGPNGPWRRRADSDPPSGNDLSPRSYNNKKQGHHRHRNGSFSPKARHRKQSPKSFRRSLFEANMTNQLS